MESKMKTPAFEEIVAVVEAAKAICGGTIPESEFRNETWMLRLTLALLAEFEGEPSKVANSKETIALEDVRAALRAGWISEGGLKPVFEKERTTWTDAILGGVLLEKGRAVCVNADNGGYNGAIVIEAKTVSALSPGVTHDKRYDQAARNIACLARLVHDAGGSIDPGKTRFLVFAPQSRVAQPNEMIARASDTFTASSGKRNVRDGIDKARLAALAESIRKRSCVVSWEYVLAYMRNHVDERKRQYLEQYYSGINI